MVCAANSFSVLPLILPQITTSRQHSRKGFPTTLMRLSSWRKLLDRVLLSLKLNVLFSPTARKAQARNADYVASREGFEKLRTLLDDTTSRLGPQIDNIQQNLEGAKAQTKFSRTVVCPLTLRQGPRDRRSWNGYPISRTQATTNSSARAA